ncbi:MAG: HAD family hydrolase [Anaerolineales bacterium]|nr:HAD family hydrolase [Anaerolineales bacterium]MCB8954455.1 HAD family hydrolase [Ardenticatenales bacterium]
MNKTVTTVIFDLDDTLLDWSQGTLNWRAFQQARAAGVHAYLRDLGYELPPLADFSQGLIQFIEAVWDEARVDWTAARIEDALNYTLRACGIDMGQFDEMALLQAYDWQPIPGVVPFPDAHEVLTTLRRRGYRLGLITNSFTPMWMRDIELEIYDLLEFFPVRITSGETGYMKPHPAIFQRALTMLDTAPDEAMYVGDRPAHDVIGAKNAGMTSVLIRPPHLDRALNGVTPDYTITYLSELLDILPA